MKKTLCVLLAAAMLLGLCACGETKKAADSADTPAGDAAGFEAVSARIDGNRVTILSAESFTDYDGYIAARFYYEFTNDGKTPTTAESALSYRAVQNGAELLAASSSYSKHPPEYGNDSLLIEPGVTIRCIAEYTYRVSGSKLSFTILGENGGELTAIFDPKALPGRPGEWSPETIDNPRYFRSYSSETTADSAELVIIGATRQASDRRYSDKDVLLVYVDYTNLEDDTSYFESDYSLIAYQDGVELEIGNPDVQPDTYGNGYADVAPGGTILVSRCWELRSESPVEVVVTEWQTDTVLCAETFPVE